MSYRPDPAAAESALIEEVARLLEDPAHRDNPLRQPLAQLLELSTHQHERMERLIRISDGFQGVARDQHESLLASYDRHLRRLEKLVRISDRYHESMRELSESLQEAALTDQLTGVGNRHYLNERLREEVERARRGGRPLSLALVDLDRFKRVNDRFGHDVGDRVLSRVAETIRDELRASDIFGRWGGEEFLLLFPESDPEDAANVCRRILEALRNMGPLDDMGVEPVTASIGVSRVDPERGYSEAISRADDLLYQAKARGRNRYVQDGDQGGDTVANARS
ncbi:biofilm regulation diguanylate cyclase SiaD [Thioalkalivibrio sp. ALE11]|uniref:biofilm regulation diguanylate cyclase SiaD n=1 Tax=Thioalkalivibrio sp. ALE11 TaxID=1265494 RepID=UPI0003826E4E|nr:biofilm regulation diguanylate cyclase SiaD [Thioalkalivibrio sp. ALE11]